jgi:hypothetical protein
MVSEGFRRLISLIRALTVIGTVTCLCVAAAELRRNLDEAGAMLGAAAFVAAVGFTTAWLIEGFATRRPK